MRRRSAQWGAALAARHALRLVAAAPHVLPSRHPRSECAACSTRRPPTGDRQQRTDPRAQVARQPETDARPETTADRRSSAAAPRASPPATCSPSRACPVIVLEAEDQVGGIAKTDVRDGYRFDLGGHRFFTKVKEVDDLWHEIMREEFLKRPRMSRIYWNKKFLDYPLRGPGRDQEARPGRADARAALVPLGARSSRKGKEETLRAVGLQPLRQAPLQPLLQVLHREGLGRADVRDPRRVGRAADQGPVVLLAPPRPRSSATGATRSSR